MDENLSSTSSMQFRRQTFQNEFSIYSESILSLGAIALFSLEKEFSFLRSPNINYHLHANAAFSSSYHEHYFCAIYENVKCIWKLETITYDSTKNLWYICFFPHAEGKSELQLNKLSAATLWWLMTKYLQWTQKLITNKFKLPARFQ